MTTSRLILVLATAPVVLGCGAGAGPAGPASPRQDKAATITNRVEVPAPVRQSLGITFVRAQERALDVTLTLAGHVDTTLAGRTPYHANVPGTVTVHVAPFEEVREGQLLVSIASPELLEQRHELHLAADAVGAAADVLRVKAAHHDEATSALSYARQRTERLRGVGASRAELDADAAALVRRIGVLKVELATLRRAHVRAKHRFEAELASFGARVGATVAELEAGEAGEASTADHGKALPRWETLVALELRATTGGVVSELPLSSGAWAEQGGLVAAVTDPSAVYVVGRALTSDVSRLRSGQSVTVVPAGRPGSASTGSARGTLRLGVAGDAQRQTLPVYVTLEDSAEWLRPGVAVFAEVRVGGTATPEVTVPVGALIRDGLQTVFFRRDPEDPDKVIRVEADLGPRDGRWAVVYGGVAPGDEVVVDGAYELKLASTRRPDVIGHFHADGTFHVGKE